MVFGNIKIKAEEVIGGGRRRIIIIVLRRIYVVVEEGVMARRRRRWRLLVMAEVHGLEAVSEVYEVSKVSGL